MYEFIFRQRMTPCTCLSTLKTMVRKAMTSSCSQKDGWSQSTASTPGSGEATSFVVKAQVLAPFQTLRAGTGCCWRSGDLKLRDSRWQCENCITRWALLNPSHEPSGRNLGSLLLSA